MGALRMQHGWVGRTRTTRKRHLQIERLEDKVVPTGPGGTSSVAVAIAPTVPGGTVAPAVGITFNAESSTDVQSMQQDASSNNLELFLSQTELLVGTNPAVQQYAASLLSAHRDVGFTLMSLAENKGVILPPGISPQDAPAAIQALAAINTGNFDSAYLNAMVQSHTTLISSVEQQIQTAQDPQFRTFLQTTLPDDQAHLANAESLIASGAGTSTGTPGTGTGTTGTGTGTTGTGTGTTGTGTGTSGATGTTLSTTDAAALQSAYSAGELEKYFAQLAALVSGSTQSSGSIGTTGTGTTVPSSTATFNAFAQAALASYAIQDFELETLAAATGTPLTAGIQPSDLGLASQVLTALNGSPGSTGTGTGTGTGTTGAGTGTTGTGTGPGAGAGTTGTGSTGTGSTGTGTTGTGTTGTGTGSGLASAGFQSSFLAAIIQAETANLAAGQQTLASIQNPNLMQLLTNAQTTAQIQLQGAQSLQAASSPGSGTGSGSTGSGSTGTGNTGSGSTGSGGNSGNGSTGSGSTGTGSGSSGSGLSGSGNGTTGSGSSGSGGLVGLVTSLYERILQREPDPEGEAFWVRVLQNGTPLRNVVRIFANSGEARALNGGSPASVSGLGLGNGSSSSSSSAVAYVDSLYSDLLGRDPDPQGEAFWVNVINRGVARSAVRQAFLNSGEYQALNGGASQGGTSTGTNGPGTGSGSTGSGSGTTGTGTGIGTTGTSTGTTGTGIGPGATGTGTSSGIGGTGGGTTGTSTLGGTTGTGTTGTGTGNNGVPVTGIAPGTPGVGTGVTGVGTTGTGTTSTGSTTGTGLEGTTGSTTGTTGNGQLGVGTGIGSTGTGIGLGG